VSIILDKIYLIELTRIKLKKNGNLLYYMNKLEEYHINLLNFKKEFEDNIENYYLLDKINDLV
jgi:hypothetical protein